MYCQESKATGHDRILFKRTCTAHRVVWHSLCIFLWRPELLEMSLQQAWKKECQADNAWKMLMWNWIYFFCIRSMLYTDLPMKHSVIGTLCASFFFSLSCFCSLTMSFMYFNNGWQTLFFLQTACKYEDKTALINFQYHHHKPVFILICRCHLRDCMA